MAIKKSSIPVLKKLLEAASDKYYNTDKNLRVKTEQLPADIVSFLGVTAAFVRLTDPVYDALESELKRLDPTWKPSVGAPVKQSKTKIELPFRMPSLDKAHAGSTSVADFTKKNRGPYVVGDKLDGVSLELDNTSGTPGLYTRGDGVIGQDVSFLLPHFNIPKLTKKIAVRGEAIMEDSAFTELYGEEFKNARNLTSGILNKKGVHKAIKDVSFVVYELLYPRMLPSLGLEYLKRLGFNVVPHKVMGTVTDSQLSSILKLRRSKSKFSIDGLVIVQDKEHPVAEDNPSWAIAFKDASEGNSAQATVIAVEWNVSKHGLIKPRVQIEPVKLAGVTVNYVTAHNAKYIVDNKIGPGAIIQLTRSGEVIPYIQSVVKPARKPDLPDTNLFGDYSWNKTKVDFVLTNTVGNKTVLVKQLNAFFKAGLGCDFIGEGWFERLVDHGYTSINEVLKATVGEFEQVEGVQKTLATKWVAQIQKGKLSANEASVAANSGFFGRNFGSKRIQMILDSGLALKDFATLTPKQTVATLLDIHGFSNITAIQFERGIKPYLKWIPTTGIKFAKPKVLKVAGIKMKDQVVVFTGFRDAALEDWIKEQGGSVGSGVNSTTTILVVKDKGAGSSKIQKAESLGVKVLSGAEFVKKYGIK